MASCALMLLREPPWVSLISPICVAYQAILLATTFSRVLPRQLRRKRC